MTLGLADIILIILYFAVILYIGFVVSNKHKETDNNKDDFLLAGRRLTLPLFVASLVATWYGSILGVGEFVYNSGLVAWVCFGLPYYIAATIFAFYFAGKIRSANVSSIPEQIKNDYGKAAGLVASMIILVITIPAAYILMLGIVIQLFSGWSLTISIITGSVLSVIYLFTGGFRSDVYTNTAQFILMYFGFFLLVVYTIIHFGSFNDMIDLLPHNHKTFDGGNSWQYILTWFIIAFQTFVDPSFHQRCSAAKSPKTARNGVLVSVVLWIVFDAMTLTVGLYAKSYLNIANPLISFPQVADTVLPVFAKGIFTISLLATIMSTLDSYAFISAATIGNDILKSFKRLSNYSETLLTRIGLIITAVAGVIIAILLPSAVEIIFKTASIAVPGLIFPLILSMNNKYKIGSDSAIIIMIISSMVSLIWTILKSYSFACFVDYEPMLIGILISFLLSLIFIKKRCNYESV